MKRYECFDLHLLLETHSFLRDSSDLIEIVRKLCVSKIFPNQEIRCNYSVLCSESNFTPVTRLMEPILVGFRL